MSDSTRSARAAIALGSNVGDRLDHLRGAVRSLRTLGTVVAASALYETAPVGGPEQGPYLNAVVVLETELPARALLDALHGLERAAGRTRDVRWGPRTLDLDLIVFGVERIDEPGLQVPHPRFRDRRFVLVPLLDAWPDATEPDGTPLAPLLDQVADQDLRRVDGPGWAAPTDRGGNWVLGQAAAFLIHLLALGYGAGTLGGSVSGWRSVGALLGIASLALFAASSLGLGRNLTPYPQPIADGTLVTGGVYGLARHPMYGAVLLLAMAAATWARSLPALLTGAGMVVFFSAKSRHEEGRLRIAYPGYRDYEAKVRRRFVPWVF